jgi:hypothetical protein
MFKKNIVQNISLFTKNLSKNLPVLGGGFVWFSYAANF